ncbi:MAG: ribosome biogenesis GTP-binding protein YihA/YsxC [Gemmatimonadales bacterium]
MLSEYVISLVTADQPIPGPPLPELAIAGRSNVGKSSLLNLLVGHRALARVSASPGKTKALNVFNWGGRCYLVDVPGYGWAKAGKADRARWREMVSSYVEQRATLSGVLWLLDLRREPSEEDRAFGALLVGRSMQVLPVLTKADKISRGARRDRAAGIARALGLEPGTMLITSARTGEGQEELRDSVLGFLA